MADGLDQAASAFATEISPRETPRPRDDSGRFTGAARPEPLFAERPLEGDPLTGDTRDAGDDARLAERERRIADGRSDERDEQRESVSDGAGAGDADGRGRHQPADAEQERRGEQEPEGENDDGQNQGDGPEGPPEQDPEAARWSLTLDGKPVAKVELDIDGQTREVSLQEMIRGYAGQEALNERGRVIEQAREQVQQEVGVIGQARAEYLQRLEYIGRVMADLTPKDPNWDQEYATDPKAAHDKERVYAHVKGRMQYIAQEMQREQAEAQRQLQIQHEAAHRHEAEYAEWGKQEFKRRSGITDQATLNNEFSAMRRAGQQYGFSDHELGTTYDPRMLAVLHDASKYRRLMANKPRPVTPDKGRTLAPGAARPIGNAARKSIDDALRKQATSGGNIDATAAVFERILR